MPARALLPILGPPGPGLLLTHPQPRPKPCPQPLPLCTSDPGQHLLLELRLLLHSPCCLMRLKGGAGSSKDRARLHTAVASSENREGSASCPFYRRGHHGVVRKWEWVCERKYNAKQGATVPPRRAFRAVLGSRAGRKRTRPVGIARHCQALTKPRLICVPSLTGPGLLPPALSRLLSSLPGFYQRCLDDSTALTSPGLSQSSVL